MEQLAEQCFKEVMNEIEEMKEWEFFDDPESRTAFQTAFLKETQRYVKEYVKEYEALLVGSLEVEIDQEKIRKILRSNDDIHQDFQEDIVNQLIPHFKSLVIDQYTESTEKITKGFNELDELCADMRGAIDKYSEDVMEEVYEQAQEVADIFTAIEQELYDYFDSVVEETDYLEAMQKHFYNRFNERIAFFDETELGGLELELLCRISKHKDEGSAPSLTFMKESAGPKTLRTIWHVNMKEGVGWEELGSFYVVYDEEHQTLVTVYR